MAFLIEQKVKKILKEKGIQQKFLCEKVGISDSLFSLSMNCKRKLQATELISICLYLDIDLNSFKELATEDFREEAYEV